MRFLSGEPRVWPGFSSSPLSCIQAPCFHSAIGSLSGQRSFAGGLRSGTPLIYLLTSKAAPGPPPSRVVRAVLRRPRPGAFMPLHVRHGGRLKAVRVYSHTQVLGSISFCGGSPVLFRLPSPFGLVRVVAGLALRVVAWFLAAPPQRVWGLILGRVPTGLKKPWVVA